MATSNYQGWLVKIGDYIIPFEFIRAESYKANANMQDLDPWTDTNGYLHRNPVELKALKVEFETPAMLTDERLSVFLANVDSNITDPVANECTITAYIPRYNRYFTQKGYLIDLDPQMYFANAEKIQYNAIRFAFVGGVYDGN